MNQETSGLSQIIIKKHKKQSELNNIGTRSLKRIKDKRRKNTIKKLNKATSKLENKTAQYDG